MNSYILLRDNKESGPFSAADLKKMGLRKNDLVWVECQSVSWRHPGEINELKNLLDEGSATVSATTLPIPEIAADPVAEDVNPVLEINTPVKRPEATSVYVSKPVKEANPDKPGSTINEKYQPVPEDEKPGNVQAGTIETKYSKSLDEIKDLYVRNMEQRKKKLTSFSFRLPEPVKRIAVYTGLILFGAITVLLFFRKKDANMPSIVQDRSTLPAKFKVRPDTLVSTPVEDNTIASATPVDTGEPGPATEPEPRTSKVEKTEVASLSARKPEEKISIETPKENPEENSTVNTEKEIRKPKSIPVESIADQLSLKTNTYTVAALGGIRDLEMTLKNDSRFLLDKVTVALNYLNPSGVIIKTEDIQFKSIEANGEQTVSVKKSNRGVKVSYRIIRIESKELSGSTAGL